jgi:hypothetical protein
VVDKALRHRERTIADVDRQQQFALGVYRHPDPLGRTLQALDGFSLADLTVLDRAEQGEEFVKVAPAGPCTSWRTWREKARCCPALRPAAWHRIRVHLKHPRRAPDPQSLG